MSEITSISCNFSSKQQTQTMLFSEDNIISFDWPTLLTIQSYFVFLIYEVAYGP